MEMLPSQARASSLRPSTCLSCLSTPLMAPSTLLSTTRLASLPTPACLDPPRTVLVSGKAISWCFTHILNWFSYHNVKLQNQSSRAELHHNVKTALSSTLVAILHLCPLTHLLWCEKISYFSFLPSQMLLEWLMLPSSTSMLMILKLWCMCVMLLPTGDTLSTRCVKPICLVSWSKHRGPSLYNWLLIHSWTLHSQNWCIQFC